MRRAQIDSPQAIRSLYLPDSTFPNMQYARARGPRVCHADCVCCPVAGENDVCYVPYIYEDFRPRLNFDEAHAISYFS